MPLTTLARHAHRRVPAQVAQVATQLVITAQPSGAVDTTAFTTQPIIEVWDALGQKVTGASMTVTASKASGSGTLAGDTTQDASAGVATFTDLAINGTGDHTLTFSATGLSSITSSTIDVAASGGGGVSPLFESEWITAAGSTDNALRDGGRWTSLGGNSADIDAHDATGLGFPAGMARVLRVKHPAGVTRSAECILGGLATPASGQSRYYRAYLRIAYTDAQAQSLSNLHPIQNGQTTTFNWHWGNNTDGTFDINLWHDQNPSGFARWYPNGNLSMGILSKNTTYRLEWKITRTSATVCSYNVRIYDADDTTLLYNDGSGNTIMKCDDGTSMTAYSHVMTDTNAALLAGLRVGKNGGPTYAQDEYYYIAGVMVRSDTWCGAY